MENQIPGPAPTRLEFPSVEHPLAVLDLFAGIGGMSHGFATAGFVVTGVDNEPAAADTFTLNGVGPAVVKNLRDELELQAVPVVVGGPPCRPWSSVNLQKRGRAHEDHTLLRRFFEHIEGIRPYAFLMENVPPLSNDQDFVALRREIEKQGYSVASRILRYSDFGAATSRRRLFTFGLRPPLQASAADFFDLLDSETKPSQTVEDAIGWLRGVQHNGVVDHDWAQVRTIHRYRERYLTGQFGWTQLEWDRPAPSFGSVAKTYILHPDSDLDGAGGARVLSVREVLSIMGFPRDFAFPAGTPRNLRYRMVANSVSPIVSAACARVLKGMLWRGGAPNEQRRPAKRLTSNLPQR